MNYKSLTIIALVLMALCAIPALAAPVWSAGNYVTDGRYDNCDSVKYNPQTDVYSCYRDINPVNEIKASQNGNGGWAEGSIRAGYSTLSDTIYVRNVLQPENGTPIVITVGADAKFRIPKPDDGNLAPGRYRATLDNLDLPDEVVEFDIAANQQGPTLIGDLKGQAVSAPAQIRTLEIIRASYGATNEVCEQIQHPAWTEHLGDYSRHCERSHHGTCIDWDYNYVGAGNGDYVKVYRFFHWEYDYRAPIQHAAYTETLCHTEGSFITVTSIVQSKVVNGELHLVADYPNLGYNAMFTDPAPGIFKTLSVDYKINGGVTVHKTVAEDVDLNI